MHEPNTSHSPVIHVTAVGKARGLGGRTSSADNDSLSLSLSLDPLVHSRSGLGGLIEYAGGRSGDPATSDPRDDPRRIGFAEYGSAVKEDAEYGSAL